MEITTEWQIDWLFVIKVPFWIWLIITLPYEFKLLTILIRTYDMNLTSRFKKVKLTKG